MWYLNELTDAYQWCQECPLTFNGLSLEHGSETNED